MSKKSPSQMARRTLAWLLVLMIAVAALIAGGSIWGKATWTPKLGLDLVGGTEIILSPQLTTGKAPSAGELNQAVGIIRQRVDASGVSEAEVTTQGSRNVVVTIPGTPSQATLDRVTQSAKLEFRAVIYAGTPATQVVNSKTGKVEASATPSATTDIPTASASPSTTSDPNWVTPELKKQYDNYTCATSNTDLTPFDPNKPVVTCEVRDGQAIKYLLGPVEKNADGKFLDGSSLSDAQAGLQQAGNGVTTNNWVVNLKFNGVGKALFGKVTGQISKLQEPQNQFAILVDKQVITAPRVDAQTGALTSGEASIEGNFTEKSAKALADQLKYGALPISFSVQSNETVSATLGSEQLQSGIIAGVIGLALVVLYSLFQYRALSSVTVLSLVLAGILVYLFVTFLSWRQGYRLSLAGIAGLIVSIGITADSFIVYFERIRDELREGRSLASAVEIGWSRALRTILASDAVNFLAAVVLYLLAVGNVRGFAFTLGLTTIIDLIVVSMFTHPTMRLLAHTKFFGEGHKFSGLDPTMLGAAYRGRGKFKTAATVSSGKRAKVSREAQRRLTIAERKAQSAQDQEAGK